MQLNTPRKSGWKGRYGWRNIFDLFLRGNEVKQIEKEVEVISKNSTIPIDRALTLYQPSVRFKPMQIPIPIPYISFKAFISLLSILCIVLTAFLSFALYVYLKDEIDYRDRVRYEINYTIQRELETYKEKQRQIELKVMEHDEIMIQSVPMRKEILKRLK